ncbi:hypothetical protein Fot_51652 [Forsythia ovata]|uniref:Uncharacterized protein n=1 Tax=Forsythia ovata TaxID=205694 RepID=A0ABD1PX25_9LAMI
MLKIIYAGESPPKTHQYHFLPYAQLASLRDLHEDFNNLIQLPSVQQALANENFTSELLDGSLKLVEICGIARDVIFLMKESVQELQSSLRINRGFEAYTTSRKKD